MPTETPSIVDSQGTTFTFNSVDFIATEVKTKKSAPSIDTTPLSFAPGSVRRYQGAPLQEVTISCNYFSTTAPALRTVAAISCSTLGISGNAICEDFELTAKVGELVAGVANFKLVGGS